MNDLKHDDKSGTIHIAMSNFQAEVQPIELTKEVSVTTKSGGTYKFRYAPLPKIVTTIQPLIKKYGLSYSQKIQNGEIITTIMHKSGGTIESPIPCPMPDGLSAQEVGSWVTYMRRYGLATAFGLVAEEDDDANVATGNKFQSRDYKKSIGNTVKNSVHESFSNDGETMIDPSKLINCLECDSPYKFIPPGISKNGKPYKGFYPCSNRACGSSAIQMEDVENFLKPEYKTQKTPQQVNAMNDDAPELPPEIEDLPF